jgi:hypothetical protein
MNRPPARQQQKKSGVRKKIAKLEKFQILYVQISLRKFSNRHLLVGELG